MGLDTTDKSKSRYEHMHTLCSIDQSTVPRRAATVNKTAVIGDVLVEPADVLGCVPTRSSSQSRGATGGSTITGSRHTTRPIHRCRTTARPPSSSNLTKRIESPAAQCHLNGVHRPTWSVRRPRDTPAGWATAPWEPSKTLSATPSAMCGQPLAAGETIEVSIGGLTS